MNMIDIIVTWVFGNFSITAKAVMEVAEPVAPLTLAMLRKGFLQLLQRVPASAAEKALAGYDKRPSGFRRDSIPYSDENAGALVTAFGKTVEVEEGVVLPFTITNVSEHVGGDSVASRKMATALWEEWFALEATDPKFMAFPLAFGFDEDDDKEVQIEKIHGRLASVRAPRKAK